MHGVAEAKHEVVDVMHRVAEAKRDVAEVIHAKVCVKIRAVAKALDSAFAGMTILFSVRNRKAALLRLSPFLGAMTSETGYAALVNGRTCGSAVAGVGAGVGWG